MLLRVTSLLLAVGLVSVQGSASSDGFSDTVQEVCSAADAAAHQKAENEDLRDQMQAVLDNQKLAPLGQYVLGQSGPITEDLELLKFALADLQSRVAVLVEDAQKANALKLLSIDTADYEVSGLHEGHFYILAKRKELFNLHAKNEVCKTHGGYLAELDDVAEQNFVLNFVKAYGSRNLYYTGGNDVAREGHFVWYNSGKPVAGLHWVPGEPNNSGGNEDCLNIRPDGINDAPCPRRDVRYICEIPLQL